MSKGRSKQKESIFSSNKLEAMSFGSKFEVNENPFQFTIESFLKMFAPNRISLLKRIKKKIGFKGNLPIIVDIRMPMNVGGYTIPPKYPFVAVNPMLALYGSEKSIAHVIFHEALHTGMFTNSPVTDESLTETMTKQKMSEVYGGEEFKSGYDSLVADMRKYFGNLSFEQMTEMVEEGDEDTFNNLVEVMVVNPSFDESLQSLSWEEIKKKLGKAWGLLQRLFPRMMNKLAKRNVGLHAEANVSMAHFELDGVLAKAAKRMLEENQPLIQDLFKKITENGKENLSVDEMKKIMFKEGFGYLYDFEPDVMERMMQEFINNQKLLKIEIDLPVIDFKFDFSKTITLPKIVEVEKAVV